MGRERLVVVGGDAAGATAASQARRGRSPDDLDIVLLEKGPYTSYAACGLPFLVGGVIARPEDLVARSPEEHRSRGIDARVRHEVEEKTGKLIRVHVLRPVELQLAPLDPEDPKDSGIIRALPMGGGGQ